MATKYKLMIQTIKVLQTFLYLFKVVEIIHILIGHLGFSKIDKKFFFIHAKQVALAATLRTITIQTVL
jgi:hypothetical protein